MDIEFINGEVKISMVQYIKDMLEESPVKFKENQKTTSPAVNNMFSEDTNKKLNGTDKEMFHRMVAKSAETEKHKLTYSAASGVKN